MLTRKETIKCLGMDDRSFLKIRKQNKIHEPKIIDRQHFYKQEWIREFFESKGKEEHGDLYNYEYTHFDPSNTKVTLECPLHGFFKIAPMNHFEFKDANILLCREGLGCPQCDTDKAVKRCMEEAKEDTSNLESLYEQLKNSSDNKEQFELAKLIGKMERSKALKMLIPTVKDYVKDNNRYAVENLLFITLKKKYDMLLKYSLPGKFDLFNIFYDKGLVAIYDNSLPIQPSRKEQINPLNIVYVWEALDFKSTHRVVKIGTSRSYRGMGRVIEVAETWNTRYKLLYHAIVDEPLKLEAQLLHLGKKFFTEKKLSDGATEFRIITEREMAKIDSIMNSVG